ncbi:MAG: DNA-directed RNA polymerases I, II, and III subunit RPABC1 [Marteilia pararefringens]
MEAHLSSLAYTLYRVRRTALQMCHDRGYLVTQSELDLTFEEFRAQHGIVDKYLLLFLLEAANFFASLCVINRKLQ